MGSVTQRAHERVSGVVAAGEWVIDATAGNGHDTLFLAKLVGPAGRVLAVDRQQQAVLQTRERMKVGGVVHVDVVLGDHAELGQLASDWVKGSPNEGTDGSTAGDVCSSDSVVGRIGAVMFNLGYLPGGEKSVITETASTLKALHAARLLLRQGGILSVVAYPGHEGGDEECLAVLGWFRQLDEQEWAVELADVITPAGRTARSNSTGPRLFCAVRK